jgi:hypothetical protein
MRIIAKFKKASAALLNEARISPKRFCFVAGLVSAPIVLGITAIATGHGKTLATEWATSAVMIGFDFLYNRKKQAKVKKHIELAHR